MSPPPPDPRPLVEILEGFRRDFVTGSARRLTDMKAEIERAASVHAEEPVRKLSRHFHGLAVAGGTSGFGTVTELASRGPASCVKNCSALPLGIAPTP